MSKKNKNNYNNNCNKNCNHNIKDMECNKIRGCNCNESDEDITDEEHEITEEEEE